MNHQGQRADVTCRRRDRANGTHYVSAATCFDLAGLTRGRPRQCGGTVAVLAADETSPLTLFTWVAISEAS